MAQLEVSPEYLRGLTARDHEDHALAPVSSAASDAPAASEQLPAEDAAPSMNAEPSSVEAANAEHTSVEPAASPDIEASAEPPSAALVRVEPAASAETEASEQPDRAELPVDAEPPERMTMLVTDSGPPASDGPLSRSLVEPDDDAPPGSDVGEYDYLARSIVLGANAWRAVELGTGSRDPAIALARALPGLYLTAIDGFKQPRRLRRKPTTTHANVVFVRGDVQATGLRAHTCDLVISNGVAHRLADPLPFFIEVARLARDDAAICVRDLCRPDSDEQLAALVDLHMEDADESQRRRFHAALRSALQVGEVEALCSAAGLTGVQVRRCSDHHWEVARARVRGW